MRIRLGKIEDKFCVQVEEKGFFRNKIKYVSYFEYENLKGKKVGSNFTTHISRGEALDYCTYETEESARVAYNKAIKKYSPLPKFEVIEEVEV